MKNQGKYEKPQSKGSAAKTKTDETTKPPSPPPPPPTVSECDPDDGDPGQAFKLVSVYGTGFKPGESVSRKVEFYIGSTLDTTVLMKGQVEEVFDEPERMDIRVEIKSNAPSGSRGVRATIEEVPSTIANDAFYVRRP